MNRKIFITFLILFIFIGSWSLFAQERKPAKYMLVPLGVITPDGRRMVFSMGAASAKTLEKEMGVVEKEAGVVFVRAKSWEAVAHVAKTSTDDLERTVADLIARVDALEKRVDALEDKVK